MPLIIKSLSVDAATFAELSDDENDFVKDPELVRDQLPMPFRMIDKLVSNLVDEAWETIVLRENERVAERSKVRPPKYECGLNVYALKNIQSLCESADGRYVFAVFRGGVHVIDAASRKVLSTLEEEHLEISQLQCVIMGPHVYLLTTVDVTGVARLLACMHDRIYLLKSLAEELSSKRTVALKYEASREADFVGILLENVLTKESWLEISQLPRDAWLKELEAVAAKDAAAAAAAADGAAVPTADGSPAAPQAVAAQTSAPNVSTDAQQLGSEANVGDPVAPSFTSPTTVLRVRSPAKFTPNLVSSPAQAFKDVSDNKVILLGTGTLLTRAYAEIRREMFQEANAEALSCLPIPQPNDKPSPEATVHFLTPGIVLPYGIEQPGILNRPTSVAVRWSGSNLLSLYCLIRPPKAKKSNEPVETAKPKKSGRKTPASVKLPDPLAEFDLKPEAVWPQADKITASCITDCSSLLALGLESGAVVLWDKQLGVMRKSVLISNHPVTRLEFLSPSVCSQSNNDKRYYPTTTSFHVLAGCADSSLHLLNCGLMDHAAPICVRPSAQTDDEVLTHVKVLTGLPELAMLVQKDGSMFLLDMLAASVLCELSMPATHELSSPWQPVMALAAFGQLLYIKGQRKAARSSRGAQSGSAATSGDESPIFAFHLRSFPTLDRFWKKKRPDIAYTTCSTIDVRIAALLTQRVRSSAARKQRLEQRWPQMKQELSRIAALKQAH